MTLVPWNVECVMDRWNLAFSRQMGTRTARSSRTDDIKSRSLCQSTDPEEN